MKDKRLVSSIFVSEDLVKALDGLEDFSHIFVVFYMHQVPKDERRTLEAHPKERTDLLLFGVFALEPLFAQTHSA